MTLEKKNNSNPPIGHLINLQNIPTNNRKRKKSKQEIQPHPKKKEHYL